MGYLNFETVIYKSIVLHNKLQEIWVIINVLMSNDIQVY